MPVILRPATSDEVAAVLRLWREAEAEPTHTDDAAGLIALLAHDRRALIVADHDGALVGSVVAAWDGWRGSLYRLVVAPDRRRQGLGQQLVAAAEERLAGLGARRCQAIVVAHDASATAFWEATGWQAQADRRRFVRG